VIVVTDLNSLRGPTRGTVELPLRLCWSGPSPVFDLGEPYLWRWLYQIVLREASRPEDLTGYLDRDTLIAVWPELALPRGVRQAWEEHHPRLRAAAGRGGLMPVSDLHRQVAAVALAAAAEQGFALGGGNALLGPRGHLPAHPGRRFVHRPGARRAGCVGRAPATTVSGCRSGTSGRVRRSL
jgi:hypothetical protein